MGASDFGSLVVESSKTEISSRQIKELLRKLWAIILAMEKQRIRKKDKKHKNTK